jgi:hypothetical protein
LSLPNGRTVSGPPPCHGWIVTLLSSRYSQKDAAAVNRYLNSTPRAAVNPTRLIALTFAVEGSTIVCVVSVVPSSPIAVSVSDTGAGAR